MQGWQWVNEGKSPDRPKWGFVSQTEGDSLVVQVCQQAPASYSPACTYREDCTHLSTSSHMQGGCSLTVLGTRCTSPQKAFRAWPGTSETFLPMCQVPTEGFFPEEGGEVDNAPLTVAVSCLMSYEHTGGPLAHSQAVPLLELARISQVRPLPSSSSLLRAQPGCLALKVM